MKHMLPTSSLSRRCDGAKKYFVAKKGKQGDNVLIALRWIVADLFVRRPANSDGRDILCPTANILRKKERKPVMQSGFLP